MQDLEPPSALSVNPADRIATALATAFERDYTHLTVVDGATRALLGYVAMPALQAQLAAGWALSLIQAGVEAAWEGRL